MEHLKVTIRAEGEAEGMYPIGYVTELLYAAIDWLEVNDKAGVDLKARLPLTRQFREGVGGSRLSLEIKEVTPEEEARKTDPRVGWDSLQAAANMGDDWRD